MKPRNGDVDVNGSSSTSSSRSSSSSSNSSRTSGSSSSGSSNSSSSSSSSLRQPPDVGEVSDDGDEIYMVVDLNKLPDSGV
jgi:hypothetical protein